jgi:hypothetical protein
MSKPPRRRTFEIDFGPFSIPLFRDALVLLSLLTVIATAGVLYFQKPPTTQPDYAEQIAAIANRSTTLSAQLDALHSQLSAITTPSDTSQLAAQLDRIDSSLSDLEARIARLETAISNNPAKALEVPLLRRDLDNLQHTQDIRFTALEHSVAQVYDINKWLLGAVTVTILATAASAFFRPRAGYDEAPR